MIKKRNKKGFSLFEVMVTISIAGLLLATVFGFFHITMKTYQKSKVSTHFRQDVQFLHTYLQNTLYSLYQPSSKHSFQGTEHTLQYKTLHEDERGTQVHYVSITLTEESLTLLVAPEVSPQTLIIKKELMGITNAQILFYHSTKKTWKNTWLQTKQTPSFVKIHFEHRNSKSYELIFEVLHGQIF
jgi:prepilin-type N-terminal cleavage/methylation domain-containing protein